MIPEDMITRHLNMLLHDSKPGAQLQYLHVVSTPNDTAVGPFGIPEESKLEATIAAIVPDAPTPQDVPNWIRKACTGIYAQHAEDGKTILFAAIGQEVWTAPADELCRRLQATGSLSEHPEAVELTIVYGACRDGRRWRGHRYLTGPNASRTAELKMLVGPSRPDETAGIIAAPIIHRMVGIR
jgi:hypothetical protein